MKNTFTLLKSLILFAAVLLNTVQGKAQTVIADAIPTTYDVNQNGGFTYSVPLRLPPGIKEMMPQLAITYNSQAGNNLLGFGWSISGLSSITRTSPTIFHDERLDPVTLTNSDIFVLDGQRLIPTTSTPPTAYREYYTEIKNFSSIKSEGVVGTNQGPLAFWVENKDGVIFRYGFSADAIMHPPGKTEAFMWPLNKVYDRNGNYMTFEYTNDEVNGNYRINKIKYTGNSTAGVAPLTEMVFNYSMRSDVNRQYLSGAVVKEEMILNSIDIFHQSALVNRYEFTYDLDHYNHLIEIKEIRPGAELPPIVINWGKKDVGYSTPRHELVNPEIEYDVSKYSFTAGDFNGDGATDIFKVGNGTFATNYQVLINNKYNSFTAFSGALQLPTATSFYSPSKWRFNRGKLSFDYDGDGYDDQLVVTRDYTATNNSKLDLFIDLYRSNGTTLNFASRIFQYSAIPNTINDEDVINHVLIIPGDYDGDGRKELLVLVPKVTNNTTSTLYVNKYSLYLIGESYDLPGNTYEWVADLDDHCINAYSADYNGDGKDDLIRSWDSHNKGLNQDSEIFTLDFTYNATSNRYYLNQGLKGIYAGALPSKNHSQYDGDFNGDGKMDILTWNRPTSSGPGNWEIMYSHGNGFDLVGFPINLLNEIDLKGPSDTDNHYFIADFNGDGKDDIVRILESQSISYYQALYSSGYNRFTHESGETTILSPFTIGDFNGDGQTDILGTSWTGVPSLLHLRKDDINHKVTSIVQDDYRLEIEHQSLAQDPSYIREINLTGYSLLPQNGTPDYSRQIPIKVVKNIHDNYDINKTYEYKNAVLNFQIGFKGFEHIFEIDNTGEKITDSRYTFNTRIPYLAQATKWDLGTYNQVKSGALPPFNLHNIFANNSSSIPMYTHSTTMVEYYGGGANGKCLIFVPETEEEYDFQTGKSKYRSFTYPITHPDFIDHGEPTVIVSNGLGQNASGQSKGETVRFTYDYTLPIYKRFKPTRVDKSYQAFNTSLISDVTEYTYDYFGLPYLVISNAGTANAKTARFFYDDFGNATYYSLGGSNKTIVEAYKYDNNGRFLVESKNGLNYVDEFSYDLWGNKTKHIDHCGLTTEYEYDEVSRLIKTRYPSLVEHTKQYDWASGYSEMPDFQSSRFATIEEISGINDRKLTFLDFYGRKLRTTSVTFDGRTEYTDVKYNPTGTVEYSTSNYDEGNPIQKIETIHRYDSWDREVESNTDGISIITTNYAYGVDPSTGEYVFIKQKNDNATTNHVKIYSSFLTGDLCKIDEFAPSDPNTRTSTYYEYNPSMQLLSTTISSSSGASSNLKTQYTYDALGRKVSVTEPNAGTTTYGYNDLDEMVSIKYANGAIFNMTYDDLGRLTQKSGQGLLYTYQYENTPGNSATGKLIDQAESTSNTSIHYTYDPNGRLGQLEEYVDGLNFISTYEYDAYGREIAHGYPTGDVIGRHYRDAYLEMIEIQSSQQGLPTGPIWRMVEQRVPGSSTEENSFTQTEYLDEWGNPIYTLNKYHDNFGYIFSQNLNSSGSSISSMNYQFDRESGNLMSRTDNERGLSENFTYDGFDRLLTMDDGNGNFLEMEYDFSGNIKRKSDVSNSQNYKWKYDKYALSVVPEPNTSNPSFVIPQFDQVVNYYPFKKVKDIEENGNRIEFVYSPEEQRSRAMFFTGGQLVKDRYYAENFEQTDDVFANTNQKIAYVWAGNELVAMLYHNTASSNSTVYYPIADYLGSITHILDNQGSLVEERSFDAWGRNRDPNDWQYLQNAPTWLCDRGYTGQEHLHDFNVINLNGRLYDPLVGRMFSPDPFISDNTNAQAYNQYNYALNNPFKYTDKDGQVIQAAVFVVAGAVGGVMNVVSNWHNITKDPWSSVAYFAVGAGAGAVSVVNPVAGGSMLAMGNMSTDIAFGNVPTFDNNVETAQYFIGKGLDVVGGANVGKTAFAIMGKSSWTYSYRIIEQGGYQWEVIKAADGVTTVGYEKVFKLPVFEYIAKKSTAYNRIFWAGGDDAMRAATAYAESTGGTTLGMTRAGQNLDELIKTKNIPWDGPGGAREMWARLSKVYAEGAKGKATFVTTPKGFSLQSIWNKVEKPILQQRGIPISTVIR